MRAVHWFRNDLRLEDNTALAAACAGADELVPLFVLDPYLFGEAGRSGERPYNRISAKRSNFLLDCLADLSRALEAKGCPLVVRIGDPAIEVPRLLERIQADRLSFNRDYTPYARRRDRQVTAAARRAGATILERKDRVVFESEEVRTQSGSGFQVYSPYLRAWRTALAKHPLEKPPALRLPRAVAGVTSEELPARRDERGEPAICGGASAAVRRLSKFVETALADYATGRDLPGVDGTSRLSAHLRFGSVSVRQCVRAALAAAKHSRALEQGAEKWVNELVWRDFYAALLAEHPRVLGGAFRREYDAVAWNDDDEGFARWCAGETGYPIVDAGMRQLVQTGWMHNRARMIVASFLVKDLLIDWRHGEAFFMEHLIDGDPASNNGGWQWSASTGTDAQPYFRVFSPVAQGERFDADGRYVRRFVPELAEVPDKFVQRPWDAPSPPKGYPEPIVDHAERRVAAIARYAAAKES